MKHKMAKGDYYFILDEDNFPQFLIQIKRILPTLNPVDTTRLAQFRRQLVFTSLFRKHYDGWVRCHSAKDYNAMYKMNDHIIVFKDNVGRRLTYNQENRLRKAGNAIVNKIKRQIAVNDL